VSVNIAASQFRRGDLEDEVRMALSEAALPGRFLTLEVQEGTLQRDGDLVATQLEAIRVAGVRVSIDDFGTGIGGIALLRRFPIDELKVDRTVIARLPGSAEDRATLDVALRHARQLGVECSAEGVEHAEQWAFLAERGMHSAQGWHIAHPLQGREIPGFVRRDPAVLAAAATGG
jgi:EAL domain-containing protein (putative c-di-GMP-specific phosphodiesterase class I)